MRPRNAPVAGLLALLLVLGGCGRKALPRSSPDDVGMDAGRLRLAGTVIREAIGRKEFPGAVLLVARKGKVVLREAFGESQWVPTPKPMAADMIFDLASMTKPIATATSIMILAERGRLSLWDRVKMFVPEFSMYRNAGGVKGDDARLWHLLSHTSGLPAYTDADEAAKILGRPCSTEALVDYIAKLKKNAPPGGDFVYSCLGYITLAGIVRKTTGQTIADFAAENIFTPLGMADTSFAPSANARERCVPTLVIDGRPLVGVVHDPLARLQGGVSGNAGLFSTADDLAVFSQMILHKGEWNGRRILSPLAVERMTSVYPKASWTGRGLGWDFSSVYASPGGDIFGPGSFGHSGFTGTSIWIDPETETVVIFLTNSIHADDREKVIPLRSRIANIAASAIVKK
jgi:CubicO group peptidase (beta-lactamase class C family)